MRKTEDIARLLQQCEEEVRPAYADYPAVVDLQSRGRGVYLVSDLHLASGSGRDATYSGTENFFADGAFRRFLQFVRNDAAPAKALLIINGDFIDFLRIAGTPSRRPDFIAWQGLLDSLGIQKSPDELERSISVKERTYGLKTDDYKSVWKLDSAVHGHPGFFAGLSEWLNAGNTLVVVTGNHDLEWHWPAVRNALRFRLAEHVAGTTRRDAVAKALGRIVGPGVVFVGHAAVLDGSVYIEHGHMYDKFSHVVGPPVLKKNPRELNIPFGSFFNRYLINKVELDFPFFDNIRPQTNLLPMLFRERFFLGLKVLFVHVPFLLEIIPKGYYAYMLRRALFFAIVIGLPGILILWEVWKIVSGSFQQFAGSGPSSPLLKFLEDQASSALMGLLGASISYGLTRLVAWLQLDEPGSLNEFALDRMKEHPEYRVVTFGHTHNPDQFERGGLGKEASQWFFNSGTWIPVIETSTTSVREDRMFDFLRFHKRGNTLGAEPLLRWNDDAGRGEALVIVKPKDAE